VAFPHPRSALCHLTTPLSWRAVHTPGPGISDLVLALSFDSADFQVFLAYMDYSICERAMCLQLLPIGKRMPAVPSVRSHRHAVMARSTAQDGR
jgi:hypothetical protein